MFGGRNRTGDAKKQRVKLHETTLENDIRYRGPLSFQHFQLFGWLCIVIYQTVIILKLGGRIDSSIATLAENWMGKLEPIAHLSLPFLLIANFAQILNADEGYKKQLLKNAAAMAAVFGLFCLAYYRYIAGGVGAFLTDPGQAEPLVQTALSLFLPQGFIAFNIFVDLFLCTLVMLFLNYKPRHVFKGKSRILFRLLALLPIAYEIGCMVLKVGSANGLTVIPVWAYPLLTVKPPMTFALFIVLALFVKTRELRFRRHGKTHEEYQAFLKTKRNSRNFSIFLAVMLIVFSIADFAVYMGFSIGEMLYTTATELQNAETEAALPDSDAALNELLTGEAPLESPSAAAPYSPSVSVSPQETPSAAALSAPAISVSPAEGQADAAPQASEIPDALTEEALAATMSRSMRISTAIGFGGSVSLILMAPVVLLFSYTRKPKNAMLSMFIPMAGMALIALLYLEAFHQLLYRLPIRKIDLEKLVNALLLSSDTIPQ